MIHRLAKEYGWSKSQINEVYPDEVTVLLKIIGYEQKDKVLQDKIDYYNRCFDGLYIQHGDPEQQRKRYTEIIEKVQKLQIEVRIVDPEASSSVDDELPDIEALNRLKEFKRSQSR